MTSKIISRYSYQNLRNKKVILFSREGMNLEKNANSSKFIKIYTDATWNVILFHIYVFGINVIIMDLIGLAKIRLAYLRRRTFSYLQPLCVKIHSYSKNFVSSHRLSSPQLFSSRRPRKDRIGLNYRYRHHIIILSYNRKVILLFGEIKC
ncbi:hypothetical protein K501DRAFT_280038 [Backusella circina FSU 941]|nr:hypothetical protein K501DRAFT_280038 [Backusella circina FSU 941]